MLAEQFLAGRSVVLTPPACELFRENMTMALRKPIASLALAETTLSAGRISPDSFGPRFTGTVAGSDPHRERVVIPYEPHPRAPIPSQIHRVRRPFPSAVDAFGGFSMIVASTRPLEATLSPSGYCPVI